MRNLLLDVLFPPRCVSCGSLGSYLCKTCSGQIRYYTYSICPVCDKPSYCGRTHVLCHTPLGLDGLITLAQYTQPIARLVRSLKYSLVRDVSSEVYTICTQHWPRSAPSFDMLIPIPLHPEKLRERGFNQSALIAQQIGQYTHTPTEPNILTKTERTLPQATLSRKERKDNVNQGFVCKNTQFMQNKTIGIVDDVTTTRTTLQAACKILKIAGAKEVWGITVAH